MIESAKKYADRLREGRWFSGLAEQTQEDLMERGVVRELTAGQTLFRRGDPPSGLFCVLEGAMRISATAASGREALLARIEPPQWFGEITVFDSQERTHDAIADEKTIVLQIPQSTLDQYLEGKPVFWRDLGLLVTVKLRLMFLYVEEAALMPIAVRMARRLMLMAEGYGHLDAQARKLELRQEQLASMLAVSRQTVNQLLKDLEGQGVVKVSYGQVEILDLDALRRVAGL